MNTKHAPASITTHLALTFDRKSSPLSMVCTTAEISKPEPLCEIQGLKKSTMVLLSLQVDLVAGTL